MNIVKHRKVFYIISGILVALSLFSIFGHGLNFGIDFKGGSILEVEYANAPATTTAAAAAAGTSSSTPKITSFPDLATLNATIESLNIGESVSRQTGTSGYIIKTKALSENERNALVAALGGEVKRFDSVGPVLGEELRGKAIWSMIYVILAIVLFITFAFRKVSAPVASWKYGLVAIVALLHDVIVPAGVFAFLGQWGGYEIDALFVTAMLVILGFSIHDTIVVFDRTRENLRIDGNTGRKSFETIVGESVSQTVARSINTSLTTVLALIVLYFVGPEATRNFSLALIIGIAVGTYSSIFIGSPLLVTLEKWQSRKKK